MRVTLGQLERDGVLEFSDGYRTKGSEYAATGLQIVRAGDVNYGAIDFSGPDFVGRERARAIGSKSVRLGDVVLTTKGTVGRTAYVSDEPKKAVYSPQLCFFRPDPTTLEPRFLYYWFSGREFTQQSSSMKSSTDMAPYISLSQLTNTTITIPPLPEQRAIAEVLGALDDKIAANRALCSTIEELSESLYRRAVGNAGDTAPFGNFLKFSYGKALKSEDRVPGDVKVVGSGGVTGWHDRALVDHSGIVVGRKGSMGSVHWVDGPHFPIDTAYSVENLTPLPDAFWLFALAKAGFPSMNSDSAVPGLNRDRALAVHTPVPLDTSEFNAVVPPLFEARAATQRESDSLSSLRDTLLPALMDGTIRVKDASAAVSEVV